MLPMRGAARIMNKAGRPGLLLFYPESPEISLGLVRDAVAFNSLLYSLVMHPHRELFACQESYSSVVLLGKSRGKIPG